MHFWFILLEYVIKYLLVNRFGLVDGYFSEFKSDVYDKFS